LSIPTPRHAAILAGCFILDRVERGGRRRDCDRHTQFSGRSKFFHHVRLGWHEGAAGKCDGETESDTIDLKRKSARVGRPLLVQVACIAALTLAGV
jgi:hypothetical protein